MTSLGCQNQYLLISVAVEVPRKSKACQGQSPPRYFEVFSSDWLAPQSLEHQNKKRSQFWVKETMARLLVILVGEEVMVRNLAARHGMAPRAKTPKRNES
jgi:hypothetical protein